MRSFRKITLGEEIFSNLENNKYLQELYENILHNYSEYLFRLPKPSPADINITHALKFADLLSKSFGTRNSEKHKILAQEIVALLHYLYPEDECIKYYTGSVLSNTGNYRGMNMLIPKFREITLLDRLYSEFNMDYLSIPANSEYKFFPSQKAVYDNFAKKKCFSYSAPTSMGKSFVMRMFIKQQILDGKQLNYVIVVPTKALINEVSKKIIQDLKKLLQVHNYRVVTSPGDLALATPHNYIFVLTPERLLNLIIGHRVNRLDYLFIDEAHKISSADKRSAFYYKIIDMLAQQSPPPHMIFASPSIPNPEIFLELVPNAENTMDNKIVSSYTPVSQMKYMIDFVEKEARYYNPLTRTLLFLSKLKYDSNLNRAIAHIGAEAQNIVYCSSKYKAIKLALSYASQRNPVPNTKLASFAREIRNEVHKQYYLADLVEKGIAYHVGYLPANIRMKLEDYYRQGLIKTIFCTSTLIEGVNLPADNLFITSYKSGLTNFKEVDFKNLVGRVGRIEYNLYGNVFAVRLENEDLIKERFEQLLDAEVPRQNLSVVTELTKPQKDMIIGKLLKGEIDFEKHPADQPENAYDLMRKFSLILIRDILKDRNSRIMQEFAEVLNENKIATIKEKFAAKPVKPDDDINISIDQMENLQYAIAGGLTYPQFNRRDGLFRETLEFMERLLTIFKWNIYECKTLGRVNQNGEYKQLSWYVAIMLQWMMGKGLNYILSQAIEYKKKHHLSVCVNFTRWEPYDRSPRHNNLIIGETLEVIEDVILFRIANYFLRFSEEYKRQHNIIHFQNDWYEYVEYGTTDALRITLQRSGFSREASNYIKSNETDYIVWINNEPKIKTSILECENEMVQIEAAEVCYNAPELFINE